MKTRLSILATVAALFFATSVQTARADVDFSVGLNIQATADFEAPLAPLGEWVSVGSYGRCWRPAHVEADWRPYCNGEWVWTDAGWYWQSDEPWAWACYHYGSWVDDPSFGWVWVPATEWAPSWVTWREGTDYIGWAPCGPGGIVAPDPFFVFVDVHHFHDHIRRHELVLNNPTIIQHTRVINRFRHEDRDIGGVHRRIAVNDGLSVDRVQRITGTKFTSRPVQDAVRETRVPDNLRRDNNRTTQADPPAQPERPRERTGRDQTRPGNIQQSAPVEPQHLNPPDDRQRTPERRETQQSGTPEQRTLPNRAREVPAPVVTPEQPASRITPPATGRPEPRQFQEVPRPRPPSDLRRTSPPEVPQQSSPRGSSRPSDHPAAHATDRQRNLPPTGREQAAPPQIREQPAPPHANPAPPPAPDRDRDHGGRDH